MESNAWPDLDAFSAALRSLVSADALIAARERDARSGGGTSLRGVTSQIRSITPDAVNARSSWLRVACPFDVCAQIARSAAAGEADRLPEFRAGLPVRVETDAVRVGRHAAPADAEIGVARLGRNVGVLDLRRACTDR